MTTTTAHVCTYSAKTARCFTCSAPRPTIPVHQQATSCYVCGGPAAVLTGRPSCSHNLTNAEAFAAADEHDRRVTLDRTPEAAYVADHRPY